MTWWKTISEAFRILVIMSLSGSVTALILFIIKPIIRNRLPKSTQYYLWLVVIAAYLVPISLFLKVPTDSRIVPPISSVIQDTVVSGYEYQEREVIRLTGRTGQLTDEQLAQMSGDELAKTVGAIYDTERTKTLLNFLVFILPSIGFISALNTSVIENRWFIRKLKKSNRAAETSDESALAELWIGSRPPRLHRNPLAATPLLIGLLRPMIILPDCEYTDAQLRNILLHELTHLQRKDILVKYLSVLACSVHWFNPITWLVRREIDRACELACDEAVILGLDNMGKQSYGDTLLYVAADVKMPHAVLSTTMCEEKKALKERLGAIMKSKRHGRLAVILSVVLIVAAILTAFALGAGRAASSAELATLIGATREEVYNRIGSPKETINEIDIFVIDGKSVHITYDENNCVEQINYNGGFVVNTPLVIRALTLDEVRALAAKGDALQYSDFPFKTFSLSSQMGGHNPSAYGVEGGYRLVVNFKDTLSPDDGIGSVALERVWDSGGSGIDIRYNDVDEFIRTHPSNPPLTETEALAIAQGHTGKHLNIIDSDWWEFADEFPHDSADPEKQKLFEALEVTPETCHLFAADDGSYIAVGRRYGTVYTYDSEVGFTLSEAAPPSS